jgi:hypothetical protein
MRTIAVSKYYKCVNCDDAFVVLFGHTFNLRLLLYSLLGIVWIFCTIVLLWATVLISYKFEVSDFRDLVEYITPPPIDGF